MSHINYYEQNLKALNVRSLDLDSIKADFTEDGSLKLLEAKNGQLTLKVITKKGPIFLHSPYNPENEAKIWADNAEFDDEDLIVVYGLGLGYHIKELIKKLSKKNRLLIIEPDPLCINVLLHNVDITDILTSEKVFIKHLKDPQDVIYPLCRMTEAYQCHKITVLEYPSITRIYNEYFKIVSREILDFMTRSVVNVNTILHFSTIWIKNMFLNLSTCLKSPGIKEFYDAFDNKPAIIISAGPSLDNNKHLLRNLKDKALLICVGTALKSLISDGIYPDIVISIDGGMPNVKHFENLPELTVPLVIDPTIHFKISEIYTGPKIIANSFKLRSYIEDICQREFGSLEVGESVACMAFDLARKVGADPIVFVGQDLAYTDGRTHSKNTVYGKNEAPPKGSVMLKDIYGNDVSTSRAMYTFKLWFEDAIRNTKGRKIIDATEGGAKIVGTQVMSLQEVMEDFCRDSFPFEDTVKNLAKEVRVPQESIETSVKQLMDLENSLKDIQKQAKRGMNYAVKLLDIVKLTPHNTSKIGSINKKLDEIDKMIQSKQQGKEILDLILQPVIKEVMLNSVDKDKIVNDKDSKYKVIENAIELYTGVNKKCQYVLELLQQVINQIEHIPSRERMDR